MRKLTNDQALEFGVQPVHHQMNNGELRFRLTRDTGSSYILALGTNQSGWQSSHIHHRKREFYIVEQGWIVIALWQSEQRPSAAWILTSALCFRRDFRIMSIFLKARCCTR